MSLLPPTYSQADATGLSSLSLEQDDSAVEPQMLIVPTVDALNFQKGFLGADGERAAIEGELQIKGASPVLWNKVTVSLRTVEAAYEREIELAVSEVVLYSRSPGSRMPLPSSLLFAIPLMADTPQALRTPHSSLTHTLTATLHPTDGSRAPVSKSLTVHTKRYTPHSHTLATSPETRVIQDPTTIKVELPRSTFSAEEAIPVYVTIPPPAQELVEQGLRLRNIRAELIRVVKVKRDDDDPEDNPEPVPVEGPSTIPEKSSRISLEISEPGSPSFLPGPSFKTVLSRSGGQCRFHSSRPVQMRFVLRQAPGTTDSSDLQLPSAAQDYSQLSDADCASITQTTLLHSVSLRVNINIAFVDILNRTEQISSLSIPITVLPPPAPLPEIAASVDAAYQKKHDRPPTKTNRFEESEFSAPHYSEGEAGPSGLPSFAPPPFDDRDAPPPFSSSSAIRLPTFLESESEIIIPPTDGLVHMPSSVIPGEGEEFGFAISQQFDGHSGGNERSSTPPPTLEMASMDTDVTRLAEMPEPERSIEVLGLVLDHQENSTGAPPPPPPAMDDPSDPPPSIDSDFRAPEVTLATSPHPSPPLHPSYDPSEPPRLHSPSPVASPAPQRSETNAPPPYLVPDSAGHHDHDEHVARPPPYVD